MSGIPSNSEVKSGNRIKRPSDSRSGGDNRIKRPSDISVAPMKNSKVPAPGANSIVRIAK